VHLQSSLLWTAVHRSICFAVWLPASIAVLGASACASACASAEVHLLGCLGLCCMPLHRHLPAPCAWSVLCMHFRCKCNLTPLCVVACGLVASWSTCLLSMGNAMDAVECCCSGLQGLLAFPVLHCRGWRLSLHVMCHCLHVARC
jgi:hypothetical protein